MNATSSTARRKPLSVITDGPPAADDDIGQQSETIATAAYFRAEQRGFAPGHELADWLAAEAEVCGTPKARSN